MNTWTSIVLFGWIPLSIAVFAACRPQPATLLTTIGGWLFLPVASQDLPGFPDFTKGTAVSLGTLAGLLLTGTRNFAGLRLGRYDLAAAALCLAPAASAVANGNGAYDAASAALTRIVEWGIPFLIGRAVFRDFEGLQYLARGIFLGGLIYVPFCLYEVRMSPQLHAMVYGFAQHSFAQCIRLEGYRPMVFMQHGLMVALWMAIASVAGAAAWWQGRRRWLAGVPVAALVFALLATTILCKSMGALALLCAGFGVLFAVRGMRSKLPLYAFAALPVLFVAARLGLDWQPERLVGWIREYAPDRADSLEFRLQVEHYLLSQFWQRPWFGWSAWGAAAPIMIGDDPVPIARDSYWIITASCFGLIGLLLFFLTHLAPIVGLLRQVSVRELLSPAAAGSVALVVALCMFVFDCMFNAMLNPVYTVALGGVTALAAHAESARSACGVRSTTYRRRPRPLLYRGA